MSIKYTLTLKSDAHVGTGVGAEVINNYVVRDLDGKPIIRSSHIKGLLRQTASDIIEPLEMPGADELLAHAFGSAGWRMSTSIPGQAPAATGMESSAYFSNASLPTRDDKDGASKELVRTISRTAIDPGTGTARETSLRTTEAVVAESQFTGEIRALAPTDPYQARIDLLLRVALLSLRSVGASRNRGSGACVVTVEGETRSPGTLLRALAEELKKPLPASATISKPASPHHPDEFVLMDVRFVAEAPVLCPDGVEVSNVLTSDFSIPASAVQGALLTCLNRIDPEAASACFEHKHFRAWPLQPCPSANEDVAPAWPVRVSLTHRVPKDMAVEKDLQSSDEALDLLKKDPATPLKAQDGVLLRDDDGKVSLWRSKEMPRIFSTHGVHSDAATADGRNLYSIEAMAPLKWRGVLALPKQYVDSFSRALEAVDGQIAVGKARSVRGMGKLTLHPLNENQFPFKPAIYEGNCPVFIGQSPLAVPDDWKGESDASGDQQSDLRLTAQNALKYLCDKWRKEHDLPEVDVTWAATGIRFGWNRHGKSKANSYGRTRAVRVILPGAVFRLNGNVEPDKLAKALIAGVGDGRERGFGCVLPHPGKATELHQREIKTLTLNSPSHVKEGVKKAMEIHDKGAFELSASQVSAVLARLEKSQEAAHEFLEQQKSRGSTGFARWKDDYDKLVNLVNGNSKAATVALGMLRDLAQFKKTSPSEAGSGILAQERNRS